jgi:RecA/RadA recombinase
MMNTGGATTTTSTATAATAGGINNSDTVYKLSHLPLRPGTLALLTKRGFHSTADVRLSKDGGGGVGGTSSNNTTVGGGISNFASELDSTIMEAVRISREVDTAIRSLTNSNSSYDDDCLKNRDRIRNCNDLSRQQKTTIIDTNHQAVSSFRFKHQEQQQKQHHRTLPQTAAQILSSQLQNPLSTRPIISFVKSIDSLLGGGFQTKEIIEVAGLPGVGKTQLAMQLCVDTFLPKQFGGLGGHSVYIDSEGSFSPERCHDMAKALVNHVQSNSQRRRQRRKQHQKEQDVVENATTGGSLVSNNFTPESILESINVFRVYDETCQSATILSLPKFLNTMKKSGKIVNLIVIDSIAFHYRVSGLNNVGETFIFNQKCSYYLSTFF